MDESGRLGGSVSLRGRNWKVQGPKRFQERIQSVRSEDEQDEREISSVMLHLSNLEYQLAAWF